MKIITVFFSLILILAGCAPSESLPNAPSYETSEGVPFDDTVNGLNPPISENFVVPDWFTDYPSIIEEYRIFIDYIIDDNFEYAYKNSIFESPNGELIYNWSCMMIEANIWYKYLSEKKPDSFGYALKDLNGNGTPELILLSKDYYVFAVFSLVDNKPYLLDVFWPRHSCVIYDSGLLYNHSSGGATLWDYRTQRISQDGRELLLVELYGDDGSYLGDGFYKVIDGKKYVIDRSEIDDALKWLRIPFEATADEIAKNSGLEYIPLTE